MERSKPNRGPGRRRHAARESVAGRTLRRFLVSQEGASGTEYAILLAVLILGAMGTIGNIGASMQNIYAAIKTASDAAGL